MSPIEAAKFFRASSLLIGLLSVVFSGLSLRYFLRRHPPVQVRQHVGRVTWTYIAFTAFGMADTSTHWGKPFRWQAFGYAVVWIMAINAQAPLLAYERRAQKFGADPKPPAPREPAPAYQTNLTTTAVLVICAVVFLALGAALLPNELRSAPEPFDPLVLSLQHVTNRVDGFAGPAIHLGEELKVDAVKCNKSGKEVGVAGKSRWVSVDPGGSVIAGTEGSGIRPATPRCQELHYSNKLPPEVEARIEELFDQGREFVTWTYTGLETPLGGPHSVTRAWSTEAFRIYR